MAHSRLANIKTRWFNFRTQWTKWEFLPMYISNIPVFFYWIFFSIKARSLFFFTSVNPSIITGGMAGESKSDILKLIPSKYTPKTLLIKKDQIKIDHILSVLKENGFEYPFILKPDIGNRGFMVELIKTKKHLAKYLRKIKADLIVQEYVDLPLELGVFYYRYPNEPTGKISSVCLKQLLSVQGDGQSNIRSLMRKDKRARLQIQRFENEKSNLLNEVLPFGEWRLLEPIGNHSRGTKFINGQEHIDQVLIDVFDRLSHQIDGVYYGRYDLRCESIEALKEGRNFKILELNGVNSEATHVYDPQYKISKAYRDIYQHWKVMFEISQLQKAKGVEAMKWSEIKTIIGEYRRHKKTAGLSMD